jgi:hypothetical protein
MSEPTYRWIDGPTASEEEWNRFEDILVARGWMSLNRPTSRVLVAEDEYGDLLGFIVMQLVPHTEPLWVRPSKRGGEIANELADRMLTFMMEIQARGWMLVASNDVIAKMAEERGMVRETSPVYVAK